MASVSTCQLGVLSWMTILTCYDLLNVVLGHVVKEKINFKINKINDFIHRDRQTAAIC